MADGGFEPHHHHQQHQQHQQSFSTLTRVPSTITSTMRPSSRESSETDSSHPRLTKRSTLITSSVSSAIHNGAKLVNKNVYDVYKSSYDVNVLYRIEMMQKVIRQTQAAVNHDRSKLQESVSGLEERNQLINELECLQMKNRLLKEEIRNARKKLDYFKHEKSSYEDDVYERGIEMSTRFQKLKREREVLTERRRKCEESKDKLTKSTNKLLSLKRELMNEISRLYPIVPLDSNRENFTISDIHLPNSEEFVGHDYKAISVAVGYVCHTLLILSKLLDVPLRYSILYYGSRSLVYDHINQRISNAERIFPTFIIKKNKEKVLFDYGVYLINKNIAQLRQNLGLSTVDLRKTLPNLHSLFNQSQSVFQVNGTDCQTVHNGCDHQVSTDTYLQREIELTSKLLNLSSSPSSSSSTPYSQSRSLSASLDVGLNELNIKPSLDGNISGSCSGSVDDRRHPENPAVKQWSGNGLAYNHSDPQLCRRHLPPMGSTPPVSESLPSEEASASPGGIGALEWLVKHNDSSDGMSSSNSSPRIDGGWTQKNKKTKATVGIVPSPSSSASY